MGNVNIFPTMFLVDPEGNIVKYYVNYQSRDVLDKDIKAVLDSVTSQRSIGPTAVLLSEEVKSWGY